MFGEEAHHIAAREAFPILIELAKACDTIKYSTLADKLDISAYGYPMSQMLGSIVTTLAQLGKQWNEELPHLTVLVVRYDTGYPSYPSGTPNEVFDAEFERIYKYPKWDAVQHALLPDASDAEMEYELFSKRQKRLRGEVPDVYQYDTIPDNLRVQVFYIWEKVWGEVDLNDFGETVGSDLAIEAYRSIRDMLCEEYGVLDLGEDEGFDVKSDDSYWVVRSFFFDTKDIDEAIDVIEFSFRYIEQEFRKFHKGKSGELGDASRHRHRPAPVETVKIPVYDAIFRHTPVLVSPPGISPDKAIELLNRRFIEHNVGYQYVSGEIIRVDSEVTHSEVVKPVLGLLSDPIYAGANDEFRMALRHYRHGEPKACITNCHNAFESCLKTICQKRGWHYDDKRANAKDLINIVLKENLIPDFMESHFSGFRSALASGVSTLRNRTAGHGQGPEIVQVPDYMAVYALNLTASNILLLVRADENLEKE